MGEGYRKGGGLYDKMRVQEKAFLVGCWGSACVCDQYFSDTFCYHSNYTFAVG